MGLSVVRERERIGEGEGALNDRELSLQKGENAEFSRKGLNMSPVTNKFQSKGATGGASFSLSSHVQPL